MPQIKTNAMPYNLEAEQSVLGNCAYRIADLQYHFSKKAEKEKTTVYKKYSVFVYAYEDDRGYQ